MALPSSSHLGDQAGLGDRLAAIISAQRLTQAEFAIRIQASPSFVSDAVRGLKMPGAQFLYAVKREFQISLDWLISGEGSMYVEPSINLDQFRVVAGLIELVRLWRLGEDKAAGKVAQTLVDGALTISQLPVAARTRLDDCIRATDDHALAASLYGSCAVGGDWDSAVRQIIRSAVAHFDLSRPALGGRATEGDLKFKSGHREAREAALQTNTGVVVKAAFHKFIEAPPDQQRGSNRKRNKP